MKAIILAAGRGSRMEQLTRELPKGMLAIEGESIIERQLKVLRGIGIGEIVIVTGYQADKIDFPGVTYYHNPLFASTNMVETLICARRELEGEVMVCYSDVLYTSEVAQAVAASPADIGVAVDIQWRRYWMARYGSTETDLESLTVSADGRITELGREVACSQGLEHRYVGLLKFSGKGMADILALYDARRAGAATWSQSGNSFEKGYMTDLLHEAIVSGLEVRPVVIRRGWLEFDTVGDYEAGLRLFGRPQFDEERG